MRNSFTIFALSCILHCFGQLSTLDTVRVLPVDGNTIRFTDKFVVENSALVIDYKSGQDYEITTNRLLWKTTVPPDSISLIFRTLDFRLSYHKKDIRVIKQINEENPFAYVPDKKRIGSTYGELNTAGNVSRGIGFGNAQDVVVNSNLNLRLNGMLANDVEVLAVISDENNPIQPEGNTQQIQDFDQVYITLKKDSAIVTVGDFLMERPSHSYFINYYKKSRGVQVQNARELDGWKVNTDFEAAISRGRFARNQIAGIEGNSGPYRLNGENGELFIIIIAGTENVYLDGKQLSRGEDNDYVINYNTGEITFTPRILITRYSRIVAEFQYSDRNYGRTVAHAGAAVSKGGFTLYVNGFNEMDLKSQDFQQDLSDSSGKKEALINSGDGDVLFENVREQAIYNPDRIMYTKAKVAGNTAYVYAGDPEAKDTFYEVFFTNVGIMNGSYSQAQTAANGKVFEYVGEGIGDYAPVEVLIAPQRLNILNFGLVQEHENGKRGIEYAISSLDQNTFSGADDGDNGGFGLKLFQTTERMLKDSIWKMNIDIDYELVSGGFNNVERYRGLEFDRQWNKVLSNPLALASKLPSYEHIANATIGIQKSLSNYINNKSSTFIRPGNYLGFSNLTRSAFQWNGATIANNLELLQSNTAEDSTELNNLYYSFTSTISRSFFQKINVGFGFVKEQSSFERDSLLAQSYGFTSYNAFIRNGDSNRISYSLSANQRKDESPQNNGYSAATTGRDFSFASKYMSKSKQSVELSSVYRQLQIEEPTLSSKPTENTLQSRLEWNLHFFKRLVRSRTFYQIGSGQEQRREFQYLQVQPGNGVYIWNDYDSNDLKTLNEFELASELDRQRADYIRIFTPVAGFITANSTKISQTVELSPAVYFKNAKKKPFIAKFNSINSLILDRKTRPTDIPTILNPFAQQLADTSLISQSQNFRSSLFFNRGNPLYSIEYSFISAISEVLLTNGFDSRGNTEHLINTRFSLSKVFTLSTRGIIGQREYSSEFFASRSFAYNFLEIEPNLQFTFKNKYRIELKTKYFNAQNSNIYGGEKAENIELGTEFRYTEAGKGSLNAGINYIKVDFDGSGSSTLGYELLRGLQNGNNVTWKLGYQRTLANNVQVVLSYEGRKSEESDVIHIGRLVARYLF
ncbi:MAG: hypothetical protein P8N47_00410 [Bacteroidia bacterium]|nr:hypothetical protein [Bacteroidia bacterium]